jgi:hypothetical protein
MAHDPDVIVQMRQAEQEFKALLSYVRGPAGRSATAFEAEAHIFRALLALGARLLAVFFAVRAQASAQEQVAPDGSALAPQGWRARRYLSVFGPLVVRRAYYWSAQAGGRLPLDETLSLPERCYSDLLRDWLEFATANDAYDQAVGLVERILGHSLAKHALERLVAEDRADVEDFYAQHPPPAATEEGPILVAQADGKGVRLCAEAEATDRRSVKKEAVVTALYTIQPHPAQAEAIADTLAGKVPDTACLAPKVARTPPVGKRLRATLEGKDSAFARLVADVRQRDGPHIRHRVALTDGDPALQQRMRERLPGFTLVLDFVHVAGYVKAAATALLGEDYPDLADYVACRLHELLTGKLERVLWLLEDRRYMVRRLSPADEKVIAATLGYLRRNAEFMRYDDYLVQGWPIATGIAEGACGHLVKDRMERAGMKWRQPGAQAILDLRSVRVNGDWDAYQAFRRRQVHRRLYASASARVQPTEVEVLALAA